MFSVIVPTYNRPGTLQSLLDSLSSQTMGLENFEVLVVYTAGDRSEAILKNYAGPLSLKPLCIEDPEHHGKSASLKRNCGARAAQHEWLAFIDDDCIADTSWLKNAQQIITEKDPVAIEGLTVIPSMGKQTFTSKGMQFLSQFGGFQTCNMFYRKKEFLAVGGFDPHFPFYLEDTDLAWSILEKNHPIVPAKNVVVTHPVPPAKVYRWIENAVRARKIPYLAKKHPVLFKKMNFRALSWSRLWMGIGVLLLLLLSPLSPLLFAGGIFLYIGVCWLYVIYLLHDCDFKYSELLKMMLAFPLVPPISVIQLLRGNLEQRTFVL